MKILDIHTHHSVPQPHGVINIRVRCETEGYVLHPEQYYSVGIHPWDTSAAEIEEKYEMLDTLAAQPEVVAIGEAGIDLNIGGPLFRQLNVFRHNVELSERLRKPLIIHDVKAHDIIIGARRDLQPAQPWAIHGFRQKPEVAAMMLRAGLFISFGAEFNPETLKAMPADRILAETDESELTIEEIIARLSQTRGEDLTDIIADNSRRFLGK
ncbi:MAG: TatD family hydrolase [Muribaculaceae bacterium]|nr:TatD family hydrolase [Muribaculaceae bacterium]